FGRVGWRRGVTPPAGTASASREERRQRQIAHRVQARRGGEHLRNRIDDDRRGRDVAVDAARQLHRQAGRSLDLHRVVRLGRSEVRLHVQLDHRLAFSVPDAVLDDAADVSGIDREELARDRHRCELRLNLVADPIERPAERVRDHRDGLGQPDVAHAAVVHLLLELLGGEAGADLLLERQPADSGVLDAIDEDAIDALAHRRERDRQRVHREAGVDAGAEHGDSRLLRHRVDRARLPDVRVARIRELLGGRHDRRLRFQDRLDLRHHLLDRRARAEDDDVGLSFLQRLRGVARHLHVQPARQADDVAEIAIHFGRIDVDRADDLESRPRGDLLDDRGADRSEAEVHYANIWHKLSDYMSDAWAALRDGVRRVQRAPAVLFGLWCLTLAAAVQVALTQAAADVPSAAAWLQDLVAQPTDAAAAIALHGAPRDAAALACTSIVAWLFVAGGVLDRYARDRAVRTPGFFAAAGVFFFRFLRLAIAQAVVYAALVTLVPDATAAGAAIALVSVIVDYAKVRMVVED